MQMQGTYKPFDQTNKDLHNERACAAVENYLTLQGIHTQRNDDLYGPDVIMYKGFKKFTYIEVEIKRVWLPNIEFPWATIQLPERKGKFLRLGLPIEFWILRKDCKAAVIIPDYVLSKDLLIEVPNRLVASGELFYKVPIDKCIRKDLT